MVLRRLTQQGASHVVQDAVIVALLQPTPEVVEQFDDILMVNEDHMVYHGPRTEILDYFEERGFCCPPHVDPAGFFIEVTSGRCHRYSNGKKTQEAISTGFNLHQCEKAEDFQKAKSMANLARSKQKSAGVRSQHPVAAEPPEAHLAARPAAAVG
ncbi:hypothetical protein PHYPSEUDO_002586 [Phytophthora pseudosyringae]|uniref:ABC transporter family G domain-containing protein n=1 Tax=Phytophthora pseudosyringae TaxID=221518 RepID=A0A8T1VTG0_9STRA|nr:hypothetical protein PHYPSEUDO_002586 [Phytophthora pseudosyringae]